MDNSAKYELGKKIFENLEKCLESPTGTPEYTKRYAREIVDACTFKGYDTPISKNVMFKALEEAEKTNKRVMVVPDEEFQPGGSREHQCDGWSYHPVLIDRNIYTDEEKDWATGGNSGDLPTRITPSMINSLMSNEIFVFGSNEKGMHMGGAARIAYEKFGAEWGNGEGLQGQSYALPTMEGEDNTRRAVKMFTEYAYDHPEYLFYVTQVGCGIAGYTPEQIAPMFESASQLSNVYLPISFWKVLMNKQ